MFKSREIDSPQVGIHRRLTDIVEKHIRCDYLKPVEEHNDAPFREIEKRIKRDKPIKLILDSCCGTGVSSYILAKKNPTALVVGLDQSAKRIQTHSEQIDTIPSNCLMLRANCEDVWRRCVENGIRFDEHYLLYPNPYPKAEHLKRRWHGHPVFPVMVQLAKQTHIRSNWKVYLDEFRLAWMTLIHATNSKVGCEYIVKSVENFIPDVPLTLFERKYSASGQPLYRLDLYSHIYDEC